LKFHIHFIDKNKEGELKLSYAERSLAWFFRNRVIKGFLILGNAKFLFFSILTLFWAIFTPISIILHNYLSFDVLYGILSLEMGTILSFLVGGILINFIPSTRVRILITCICLSIFSLILINFIPLEIQYCIPVFGAIIFAGVLGISLFISIRAFNTSWVNRLMVVGKSPKKLFMHNTAMFINVLSILAPIFLFIRYLIELNIFDLILSIGGFVTWSVVIYATTHFSDHYSYDIFASILSATYFITVIFFLMYIGTPLFIIILDGILFVFGISAIVQILYARRTLEKVSVYVPKAVRSPDDSNIIIIQDEEEEGTTDLPGLSGSEYAIEEELTEVRSNYDGLIVMILGLTLCFHFILVQYLAEVLIGPGFIYLPFGFNFMNYHFILVLLGYSLILGIYVAFRVSHRFRGYTTRTLSERAAFVKFLSLIDEEERKELLKRISKTVTEILVGGLMDLLDTQRQRWQKKGREFLRRLFRRDEE